MEKAASIWKGSIESEGALVPMADLCRSSSTPLTATASGPASHTDDNKKQPKFKAMNPLALAAKLRAKSMKEFLEVERALKKALDQAHHVHESID